jgi:hypothetical protein
MPNFNFEILEATEDELKNFGLTPGVDFEAVDWRAGEMANHETDEDTGESQFTAGGLVHELVKSFGFRRDSESASWSWSVDNIGKSFEEDPIWTTLDYLLLVVPMAKVGMAATKVAKGTGAAGRTFKMAQEGRAAAAAVPPGYPFNVVTPTAGATAEQLAAQRLLSGVQTGRRARAAGKVAGWISDESEGFAGAVELEMRHGVARNKFSRWFASNVAKRGIVETFSPVTRTFTRHLDPEWEELIKISGGGDPFEKRAMYDVFRREAISEKAMYERIGEELIRLENKVLKTTEEKEAFGDMLRLGKVPEEILNQLGRDEAYLANKIEDFRLRIHEKGFDLGLMSEETHDWGTENWFPRVWANMEAARIMEVKAAGRSVPGRGAVGGYKGGERLRHGRKITEEEVEHIQAMGTDSYMRLALDPAAGLSKLMEVGAFVAGQGYLQRMAGSSLVQDGRALIDNVVDLARGTPEDELDAVLRQRFYRTYPKQNIDDILKEVDYARARGEPLSDVAVDELVKKRLGWRNMDDAFKAAGIKGYMSRVPDNLKNMYMDPQLARDLAGMGAFVEALPATVRQVYMTAMSHFKATKTSYNPATHSRNIFGAFVFHHLTVGGLGPFKTGFQRGWRAIQAGSRYTDDVESLQDWQDFVESGLAYSSFDREIVNAVQQGLQTAEIDPRRVTALDWLKLVPGLRSTKAGAAVVDKTLDAASWAERKYRLVDELAKADAFLIRRDHWRKALREDETWRMRGDAAIWMEARAKAAQDVVKYQPVFHQNSPFTDFVRNAIPFSSFTTEAVRVWSNAMKEKPHLAYFYNHMAESMSQMLGAVAGFDTADLEAAKAALPEYAQHKKMVVLPFRVDGKPTFLDLSYMLPMGNISESGEAEASFFDRVHMDPFSANPFLSFGYALKTGKDPFSGQPIEPRLLEQQLEIAATPTKGMGRKALGMAEHTMKMALPPLVPPGYAGMNLYELVRGQKHPVSGSQLEEGVLRTIMANALGFRTYEADVSAQLLNVKREQRRLQEEMTVQWKRWQYGHANGRASMMETALNEIRQLKLRTGASQEDTDKYLLAGMKRREVGKWRGISTQKIEEVLTRSRGVMGRSDEDLRMMSELSARYKERALRTKVGKEKLAPKDKPQ